MLNSLSVIKHSVKQTLDLTFPMEGGIHGLTSHERLTTPNPRWVGHLETFPVFSKILAACDVSTASVCTLNKNVDKTLPM